MSVDDRLFSRVNEALEIYDDVHDLNAKRDVFVNEYLFHGVCIHPVVPYNILAFRYDVKHFGANWREFKDLIYYSKVIDGQENCDQVREEDNLAKDYDNEVPDLWGFTVLSQFDSSFNIASLPTIQREVLAGIQIVHVHGLARTVDSWIVCGLFFLISAINDEGFFGPLRLYFSGLRLMAVSSVLIDHQQYAHLQEVIRPGLVAHTSIAAVAHSMINFLRYRGPTRVTGTRLLIFETYRILILPAFLANEVVQASLSGPGKPVMISGLRRVVNLLFSLQWHAHFRDMGDLGSSLVIYAIKVSSLEKEPIIVLATTHAHVGEVVLGVRFLKIYRRIDKYMLAMKYFSTFEWEFNNNKCMSLFNSLCENDKEIFYFDASKLNYKDYLLNTVNGVRKYIFKESDDTIPAGKGVEGSYLLKKSLSNQIVPWLQTLTTRPPPPSVTAKPALRIEQENTPADNSDQH
uniref:Fatty acyl-CoA reductase C-terminal domain-containing protein n=1 Tax=Timema douglasi TaxID=61478 RepID=A0A7R8VHJ1_TIMDO|nr:unnamed protein product [Timema douglasi]